MNTTTATISKSEKIKEVLNGFVPFQQTYLEHR
jgi:hypothetical protein